MSDLLTPEELQALIEAVEGEQKPREKVRPFQPASEEPSFHPSQELASFLETQQKKIAEKLTERLSSFLGLPVASPSQFFHFPNLEHIVQEGHFEAGLFLIYELVGQNQPLLVAEEFSLIYPAVHRLLGGAGTPAFSDGPLTELEWPVVELFNDEIVKTFCETWPLPPPCTIRCRGKWERTSTGSSPFRQEELFLMGFELRLAANRGILHFIFPLSWLGQLCPDLFKEDKKAVCAEAFEEIPLTFSMEIGPTRVAQSELADLSVGDVIKLDQPLKEFVSVRVGGKTKFLAQPGQVRNHRAIRIAKRCSPPS